jgi:site-specific recombinase XerD
LRGIDVVDSTLRVRIGETRTKLLSLSGPTAQTIQRVDEITGRFERFLSAGFGVELIAGITTEHVDRFVRAKGSSGEPSIATMHLRRSALRMLFRIARTEFGFEGDPTIDLALPPKSTLAARPLTNDEIALGRSYSLHTLTVTRQPAAWALGEATAITAELPHLTVGDLDLDNVNGPRVWLHGSTKRVERWGLLDDWGAAQLERRASALRNTQHLIYSGNGESLTAGQVSCCNAIKETLIRCGLDSEPDVRPSSLAAWAGQVALEETDSIEGVARRLGLRSLDTAARFIGYSWSE